MSRRLWSFPANSAALSTAAIVAAAILAACSTGSGETTRTTSQAEAGAVEILTRPGLGGASALSTFVLIHDPQRNCLFSIEEDNNGEPGTGGRVVIVWPDGYSARSRGDSVTVFDAEGRAVARTGVPFRLPGGGGPATEDHCDAVGQWVAGGDPMPVFEDS